ncbi:MAG: DUF2461 domain-containing protein [Ferruginibacter sp.]
MLQPPTFKFLKDLKKNNNKPWFDEHRKQYEAAKADFYQLVDAVIAGIISFDGSVAHLKAKDCAFRINRDVRFSKDKSPYKTNMGAFISKGGKKINSAGYYIHIEPGQAFIAGGFYMPDAPQLAKIRQEIDYSFDAWKKIVTDKGFKKIFEKGVEGIEVLSRPPKGYDETNPAISYLKMKSFIVSREITDKALQDKTAVKEIIKTMAAMKPMISFLNEAVD